jgi:HSP20 family molecular chaperone IbpA
VDEGRVTAKYADGVLKVTLPLKVKAASRKITVS